MNNTSIKKAFATFILASITLLVSVTSFAQLDEVPRTPDGKPDFSGFDGPAEVP